MVLHYVIVFVGAGLRLTNSLKRRLCLGPDFTGSTSLIQAPHTSNVDQCVDLPHDNYTMLLASAPPKNTT